MIALRISKECLLMYNKLNMSEINKKNIPPKYKVPLQGKMNKGVFDCINSGWGGNCSNPTSHRQNEYFVIEDIIGFAESQWGTMVVWECKGCGQKQFFHLRENENNGIDYVKMFHDWKTTGKY